MCSPTPVISSFSTQPGTGAEIGLFLFCFLLTPSGWLAEGIVKDGGRETTEKTMSYPHLSIGS